MIHLGDPVLLHRLFYRPGIQGIEKTEWHVRETFSHFPDIGSQDTVLAVLLCQDTGQFCPYLPAAAYDQYVIFHTNAFRFFKYREKQR